MTISLNRSWVLYAISRQLTVDFLVASRAAEADTEAKVVLFAFGRQPDIASLLEADEAISIIHH